MTINILSSFIHMSAFCNTQQYIHTVFSEKNLLQQFFFSPMMQLYFQIYVFFTIFQSLTCTNFVSFIFVSQLKHMEKTLFVNTVLIFSHLNRSCAGHLFANHSVPSAWIIRSGSMLCSSQSSNPVYYVVEGQQAF